MLLLWYTPPRKMIVLPSAHIQAPVIEKRTEDDEDLIPLLWWFLVTNLKEI